MSLVVLIIFCRIARGASLECVDRDSAREQTRFEARLAALGHEQ